MRLILSNCAKEDLLEIWEFIADHDELAADRYIDHLRDRALELLRFPELGRARNEIHPNLRSLLARNHLLFHKIKSEEVQTLRILHGVMDLPNQSFKDEI
jgi:toxin ParE1/3/4